MKKNKVICIIPARGGSKGLKLKNLRKICGKPLISYPIKAAKKSKVCDKIIVSTDSSLIAKEAIKFGAEVPFLRKKNFSGDLITTEATLKNALSDTENYFGENYDICVFLTCTNLFRQANWIRKAVNILKKNSHIDSAFSVHGFYKHVWHKEGKKFKKVSKWMRSYTSRQVGQRLYREDTGLASATRAKFWRKGKRIGKKVSFIINNEPFTGIDIHTKQDLYLAETAMRYAKKNKLIDH